MDICAAHVVVTIRRGTVRKSKYALLLSEDACGRVEGKYGDVGTQLMEHIYDGLRWMEGQVAWTLGDRYSMNEEQGVPDADR